ncbi:hypothetical protein TRVL_04857 [Trypanosoma vivax]|nr:hypothetical protein TRVL_04857 [Trypanosoma vivax]
MANQMELHCGPQKGPIGMHSEILTLLPLTKGWKTDAGATLAPNFLHAPQYHVRADCSFCTTSHPKRVRSIRCPVTSNQLYLVAILPSPLTRYPFAILISDVSLSKTTLIHLIGNRTKVTTYAHYSLLCP